MKDLLYFLGLHLRRWPWLLAGILLMLAVVAANVGLLALSGWFVTATGLAGLALAAGAPMTLDIYRPAAGIRFFAVGRAVARYGERLVNHEAVLRTLADLRSWFFGSLLPLDPASLARLRDGELLNRITGDVDALDHLFLRVAGPTLVAVLGLLAGIAFLSLWSVTVALWSGLVLVAGATGATLIAGLRGAGPARRLAEDGSRLREYCVADLQALAELRIFDNRRRHLENLLAVDQRLTDARASLGRQAAVSDALITVASQLAIWMAAFLGAGLVAAGTLDGPLLALLLLAVLALGELLRPLPGAWQLLARVRWSARRLRTLAEQPMSVPEPANPVEPASPLPLAFTGVSYRHRRGQPWCLRDVDLTLEAGERIAILGPSGTGKSALLALVMRHHDPEAGHITLGHRDLRRISRASLDNCIAHLPQRTVLFHGTLADNLRLARPDAADGLLWQALAMVALDQHVQNLPEGLDTWLGHGGSGLSGGQARRLALARTLLKPAPLVLLDEPTEGLDRFTERQVLAGMDRWLGSRSLLVIAHDTERLPPVDRILRLEHGRLESLG